MPQPASCATIQLAAAAAPNPADRVKRMRRGLFNSRRIIFCSIAIALTRLAPAQSSTPVASPPPLELLAPALEYSGPLPPAVKASPPALAPGGLMIDTSNRAAVVAFYKSIYV